MIRGAILVRVLLAIVVAVPTFGLMFSPVQIATAGEGDDSEPSSSETVPSNNTQPEVFTVTREYSVTQRGKDGKRGNQVKERRGKQSKHSKRHVNAEVITAKKNGTTVRLYPTLGVSDYGPWEDVRGQVHSTTTARADDVRRMMIGGALLQANRCADIYDDPDPIHTGEEIVSGVRSGTSPWTNFYRGFNDCWRQTGHNHFRIKLENGNLWATSVDGDVFIDL